MRRRNSRRPAVPGRAGTEKLRTRLNFTTFEATRVLGSCTTYGKREQTRLIICRLLRIQTSRGIAAAARVRAHNHLTYGLCGPSTPPSVVRSCDHSSGSCLERRTKTSRLVRWPRVGRAASTRHLRGIYFFKICSICSRTTSYAWPYSSSHRNILCTSINRCRFLRMASRLRFARMDGRTGMSSKGNCTAKPS